MPFKEGNRASGQQGVVLCEGVAGDETCVNSALQVSTSGAVAGDNLEPPVEWQPEVSEDGGIRVGF